MNDMLINQFKGRYIKNRLTCQTSIDLEFLKNIKKEIDIEQEIKSKMSLQISTNIIDNSYTMWRTLPSSPEVYGKTYEIQTYVFHPIMFEKLIKDAFDAGFEAAKGVQ